MLLDLVALLGDLVLQVAVEAVDDVPARVAGCVEQVLSLDLVDVHLELGLQRRVIRIVLGEEEEDGGVRAAYLSAASLRVQR